MKALPNAMVPLFEFTGEPTGSLREILTGRGAEPPRVAWVNTDGTATPAFRTFLAEIGAAPLPGPMVAFADKFRRPTRAFTALLMGLP